MWLLAKCTIKVLHLLGCKLIMILDCWKDLWIEFPCTWKSIFSFLIHHLECSGLDRMDLINIDCVEMNSIHCYKFTQGSVYINKFVLLYSLIKKNFIYVMFKISEAAAGCTCSAAKDRREGGDSGASGKPPCCARCCCCCSCCNKKWNWMDTHWMTKKHWK